MKLIAWLRKRKSFKNPKKINLSNILNYAEAEIRHWKSTSKFLNNPVEIDEQSIWRLGEIKKNSPLCIENGFCVNCGCDIKEKSFESQGCDNKCYPALMNKKTWNEFKLKNNLNIS